jgi:hypothetical protein
MDDLSKGYGSAVALIYLHIGRNKAGSTTLQDVFLDRRADLEARGVHYAFYGHMRDIDPRVPGFSTPSELVAYAREHPDKTILISNEFMSGAPAEFVETAAAALQGVDTQVIAYIRDYASWISSSYAFDVRAGWNARDFDSYLEWMDGRISYWPSLERWGRAFGWERMRIRSLDAASLDGGDLISDCIRAIGLDPAMIGSSRAIRSNTAMSWMTVELTRALLGESSETGWEPESERLIGYLQMVFDACVTESTSRPVQASYFSSNQAKRLTDLYNDDVRKVAERTRMIIPFTAVPASRRDASAPSVSDIPKEIFRDFIDRIAEDPVALKARSDPSAASAVMARLEAMRTP